MANRVVLGIGAAALAGLLGVVVNTTVPESVHSEGIVLDVYADPVHGWDVPTVCAGDTGPEIQRGQPRRTMDECLRMLRERHEARFYRVLNCIAVERRATVTPGAVAALVLIDDNTGKGCDNSILRDLNAGVPPEQFCRRITEQVATWQPVKRVVEQIRVQTKDGGVRYVAQYRVVPDWDVPAITAPTGWTLIRKSFKGQRVPVNCRDPLNNCRGIVLRREREQRICLGAGTTTN